MRQLARQGMWVSVRVLWLVMLLAPVLRAAGQGGPITGLTLTLAWDEPAFQPAPFVPQGYQVVWQVNGGPQQSSFVFESAVVNRVGQFQLTDCQPNSIYTFQLQTVCTLTNDPTVLTNSDLSDPLTFYTGSIAPNDTSPPVLTLDYLPTYTWTDEVTLSGFVYDDSQLYLNVTGSAALTGLSYQGTGGFWSASVRTVPGLNSIAIETKDVFGQTTTTNFTLINLLGPDSDQDGLTDAEESYLTFSNPYDPDTLHNGLGDLANYGAIVTAAQNQILASQNATISAMVSIPGANVADISIQAKSNVWYTLERRKITDDLWTVVSLNYAASEGTQKLQPLSSLADNWIYQVNTNISGYGIVPLTIGQTTAQSLPLAATTQYYAFYVSPDTKTTWLSLTSATPGIQMYVASAAPYPASLPSIVNPFAYVSQADPFHQQFFFDARTTPSLVPGVLLLAVAYDGSGSSGGVPPAGYMLSLVEYGTLLVTVDNQSRAYGSTNPILTGTLSGLVNNDIVSLTNTCIASAISPVGNYPIQPTLFDPADILGRYRLMTNNGVLTVTGAPLTVTANSTNRTYGSPNPTFTATISGFVNGNTADIVKGSPAIATVAATNSPTGVYDIVPALGKLKAANYQFANFVNGSLAVSPAPLEVSVDNQSRVYGDANPVFTGALAPSLRNNDPITLTFACDATPGNPVGSYLIVPILSDPNRRLPNYAVATNGGSLTVTPALLTVAANNATRSIGSANPEFTATISGFVNGDTPAVISGTPNFATAAFLSSPPGVYDLAPSLGTLYASNYQFGAFLNGTLTVVTMPLLVVTVDSMNRVYGTANPLFTGALSGLRTNDHVGLTFSCSATPGSPAGTYTIVPVLADPDGVLSAYLVTTNLGSLTVAPASLTVTANNASRDYAANNPPFSATITGFVNGDTVAVVSGSPNFTTPAIAGSPVGVYDLVPSIGTLSAADYRFDTFVKGTLTVGSPAVLVVAVDNRSRVYGVTNPVFSGTLTGLQNGDLFTVTYACEATTNSPVGRYDITPKLEVWSGDLANYTIVTNQGVLRVTPASLTVTANNASRQSSLPNPPFEATITGFVNGDTTAVVTGSPDFTTSATPTSPAGVYDVVPSRGTLSATNYTFDTFINGTLTVESSLTLTVTVDSRSRLYGAANPEFTGTLSGLRSNDQISVSYTCAATPGSPTGKYAIVPRFVDPDGKLSLYTVTTNRGALTVRPARLTVAANNGSRPYGGANQPFTATISGFVNGETTSVVSGSPDFSIVALPGSSVGNYDIVPKLGTLTANNYLFGSFVKGTLTITPASLVVTAGDTNRVYGAANPVFTGTLTGLHNNDNISAAYWCGAGVASPIGKYDIVPLLADPNARLANYSVTTNKGTLTVSASPLVGMSLASHPLWLSGVRSVPTGLFQLRIEGKAGAAFRLEASTNGTDWVGLMAAELPALPVEWVDPESALLPQRFYRLVGHQSLK